MDNYEALGHSPMFARFSCDFCRQKKLKCSREIPKCSTCTPWPGSCEYSRDKSLKLGKTKTTSISPDTRNSPSQASIEPSAFDSHLQDLEQTVSSLTASTDRPQGERLTEPATNTTVHSRSSPNLDKTVPQHSSDSGLYIGPSHSFSFLRDPKVSNSVAHLGNTSFTARKNAYSELQDLSTTLSVPSQIPETAEQVMGYYVPARSVGYRMISEFLEQAEIGEPFFTVPSDDLLRQVVFEPGRVRKRAWIIYFNYTLLCAASTQPNEKEKVRMLRHNTQLALNDSSIFLEPSEVNVQTLALLALHGDDYAAPNLSWMLLSHACRQAEALGLHVATHLDYDSRQRRLCLFWLLFTVDKSCSLAFGRRAFLPTNAYLNTPVPDHDFLLKFHPHEKPAPGNRQSSPNVSRFGAIFFGRSIELAKIMGNILDALATNESLHLKRKIRTDLDSCNTEIHHALLTIMRTERVTATPSQLREMALGINSFRFQYLHVLILLMKGDTACSGLRLSSAREALSLLPSIVSNWSSVYNGVVWQLLYFPFIPFFVVFEEVVNEHGSPSPSTEQDLGLLSTAVEYFASMQSQVCALATVCKRLQHAATVFLELAQAQTRTHDADETAVRASKYIRVSPVNRRGCFNKHNLERNTHQPSYDSQSNTNPTGNAITEIDMRDASTMNFLEWLPADIDMPWLIPQSYQQGVNEPDPPLNEADAHIGSLRERRGLVDSTFDWFSWDSYYTNAEPNSNFI